MLTSVNNDKKINLIFFLKKRSRSELGLRCTGQRWFRGLWSVCLQFCQRSDTTGFCLQNPHTAWHEARQSPSHSSSPLSKASANSARSSQPVSLSQSVKDISVSAAQTASISRPLSRSCVASTFFAGTQPVQTSFVPRPSACC